MDNPLKGEVSRTVKGVTWTLTYDIDALVRLETAVRAIDPALDGVRDILARLSRTLRVGLVRPTLQAGLALRHPGATQADADALIKALKLGEAAIWINEAISAAFDDDEDDDDDSGGAAAGAPADPPSAPPAGAG